MGQLHLRPEVEPTAAVRRQEGEQGSAGEVERLERDIAEVHDLGQERVGADVLVERVADLDLLVG